MDLKFQATPKMKSLLLQKVCIYCYLSYLLYLYNINFEFCSNGKYSRMRKISSEIRFSTWNHKTRHAKCTVWYNKCHFTSNYKGKLNLVLSTILVNYRIYDTFQTATEIYVISPVHFTQKLLAKFDDPIYYYRYDFVYDKSLHKILFGIDIDGKFYYMYFQYIQVIPRLEVYTLNVQSVQGITLVMFRNLRDEGEGH